MIIEFVETSELGQEPDRVRTKASLLTGTEPCMDKSFGIPCIIPFGSPCPDAQACRNCWARQARGVSFFLSISSDTACNPASFHTASPRFFVRAAHLMMDGGSTSLSFSLIKRMKGPLISYGTDLLPQQRTWAEKGEDTLVLCSFPSIKKGKECCNCPSYPLGVRTLCPRLATLMIWGFFHDSRSSWDEITPLWCSIFSL